jgi:hypothetical protein
MAKQRYIKDSFWTDPYIEKCTPDEKLVFLYLLSNPQCNIAGVYEARTKRMAYEMGYDVEVVDTILKRFERDKKILLIDDYIIICNHLKHQSLGNSTAEGVNRIIEETPEKIRKLFEKSILTNSKGEEYSVLILKGICTPPIDPLPLPPKRAYSEVELSIVKLSNKYGEFEKVKLSEDEYQKLTEKLGDSQRDEYIKQLDEYIASKGKKYASHYATILSWSRRKAENPNQKKLYVAN